jgi:hypothetical protein
MSELSEIQAEALRLRRERGSIVDPVLIAADEVFDETPERRRISELMDQLKPTTEPARHLWFELDAAIDTLVDVAQDWVLDRMVIGLGVTLANFAQRAEARRARDFRADA